MNPIEKLDLKKDTFTKKELVIYNILKNNPDSILRESAATLSKAYGVSQATITRFCQKLGYDGFNEFKFDIFRYQKQDADISEVGNSKIDNYCKLLKILEETLDKTKLERLADYINRSDKIILCGSHKSTIPAEMLKLNLFKFKKTVQIITLDLVQEMTHFVNQNDLIIYFTNNGSSLQQFKPSLKLCVEENKCKLAVITMNDKLSIKNISDPYIWIPSSTNQHFSMYLENQIFFLIYVDLLTSQLSKC